MDAVAALAQAVETSALGVHARSSVWLYPLANLVHVLGAALLVGAVATFDIAVLRRAGGVAAVLRAGIPVAALGLALQIGSGIVLFAAEAGPLMRNPAFLGKLAFIAVGLVNIAAFHLLYGRMLRSAEAGTAGTALPRRPAAISLAAWIAALLLGRAIAYV